MFKKPIKTNVQSLTNRNTFVSCQLDGKGSHSIFIAKENIIYRYGLNQLDGAPHQISSKDSIMGLKLFGDIRLGSQHLFVITENSQLEIHRVIDSMTISTKVIQNLNVRCLQKIEIFLDQEETEIYVVGNRSLVYLIKMEDALSSSFSCHASLIYASEYELIGSGTLTATNDAKNELFYVLEISMAINRLYFSKFRMNQKQSKGSAGLQLYKKDSYQMTHLDFPAVIIFVCENQRVIAISENQTVCFQSNVLALKNHGIHEILGRKLGCKLLPEASYIYNRDRIFLSLYTNAGDILETVVDLEKQQKVLKWTLKKYETIEWPIGTIEYFKRLMNHVFVVVSKMEGVSIINMKNGKVLQSLPYENKLYFDSHNIRCIEGNMLELATCGGFSKTLGFVETWKLKLPSSSIKVLKYFDPRCTVLQNFWTVRGTVFWYNGELYNESRMITNQSVVHVTQWGSVLALDRILCGCEIPSFNDSCIVLNTKGEISLVKENCNVVLSAIPEVDCNQKHAIAAQLYSKDDERSLFVAVAAGNKIHCFNGEGDFISINSELRAIRDICIICREQNGDYLLAVSSDEGRVIILRYWSVKKGITFVFGLLIDAYTATSLCNIPGDVNRKLVWVYNDAKTYILNVEKQIYYEWPLGFGLKKLRHYQADQYMAITPDDQIITFQLLGTNASIYEKQLYVSQKHLYLQLVLIGNPQFALMAAEATNASRTQNLVLFDVQEMRPLSTFKFDVAGMIGEIVAVESSDYQTCLVSFLKKDGSGSILYLLSITPGAIVCSASLIVDGIISGIVVRDDTIVVVAESLIVCRMVHSVDAGWDLVREPIWYETQEDLSWACACFFDSRGFLNVMSPQSGLCTYNLDKNAKRSGPIQISRRKDVAGSPQPALEILTQIAVVSAGPSRNGVGSANLARYDVALPTVYAACALGPYACIWEVEPTTNTTDRAETELPTSMSHWHSHIAECAAILPPDQVVTRLRPVCAEPVTFLATTIAGPCVVSRLGRGSSQACETGQTAQLWSL